MKLPNLTKGLALAAGAVCFCSLLCFAVLAWSEPGATPPDGNVASPINTSGNSQTKTGALNIKGASFGLIDGGDTTGYFASINGGTLKLNSDSGTTAVAIGQNGFVGIGTASAGQMLDVAGNAKAQKFCLNDANGVEQCCSTWAECKALAGGCAPKTPVRVYIISGTSWAGAVTDGSNITVECIGAGGAGGGAHFDDPFHIVGAGEYCISDGNWLGGFPDVCYGPGGAGGEYRKSSVAYVSGTVVTGIQIGTGGAWKSRAGTETHWNTNVVVAHGGEGYTGDITKGGYGGIGDVGYNGGNGGAVGHNGVGGGGGGAAGMYGAGGNGYGASGGGPGGNEWDRNYGPGAGGNGSDWDGGNGGAYGGGGGSGGAGGTGNATAGSSGGNGANGIIVITYTPL